MDDKQASMGMGMLRKNVVWWSPNQIALRFFSSLPPTPGNKQPILESLRLDDINNHLVQNYHVTLQSFTDKDVTHPVTGEKMGESQLDGGAGDKEGTQGADHGEQILTSSPGKYLFPTPDGKSVIMTFFNLAPTQATPSAFKKQAAMEKNGDGDDEVDHTIRIVNAFNTTEFITTPSGERIPLPPAMPNWYGGGTQDGIHGCPSSPPMPVAQDDPCIASGYSHIDLPSLSSELKDKDGSGVTVFVLDTFPTEGQLKKAAELANPPGGANRNRLLQDMVTGMQFSDPFNAAAPAINVRYQKFTALLESEQSPRTGRDLYKRLYGFKMLDHGLFVAGIIRDLARGANIECVRILNDYGIGRANDLIQALEKIVGRMSAGEDLHGKSVLINLSLVMTPLTRDLGKLGFRYRKTTALREALHQAIISAVNAGAVIVSAAGNDSNSLEMKGRIGPRYPADFPEVVSVASVTRNEKKASSFSDRATSYEQPNGIATYGGERAKAVKPPTSKTSPPPVAPEPTNCMTGATHIDGVIGVYSSPVYPKLDAGELDSHNHHKRIGGDCEDYYNAPNSIAWAYWSGTSFATPVISALVARMLEERGVGSQMTSQQVIASIQSSEVSSQALFYNKELKAPVFPACQCQPIELKEAPSVGSAVAVVE